MPLVNGVYQSQPLDQKPLHTTRIVYTTPVTLSANITWDGTNLLWENLKISVGGLQINRNQINNQLSSSPGLTDLTDGQCIYVNIHWDDGSDDTLSAVKAAKSGLTNVIDKYIIAERRGNDIILDPTHSGI